MKTTSLPFLLLLCIGLLGWSSCGDDDADDGVLETLNYDTANVTAPQLGAGFNTFAAFFPEGEVQPFQGRTLEGVQFYLENIPLETVLIVYNAGTDDRSPGSEIYSVNLTSRINNAGWYTHTIPGGIDLNGGGIWLAVEVELANDNNQSVGCDAGTRYNPNGDRLLPPTGNTWTSFQEITGSETVNWNIRGILAEE